MTGSERSQQDQKLTNEPIETRKTNRRKRYDQEKRGIKGHAIGQAAKFVDETCVTPVVNDANNQKQGAGRDAVIQHLKNRAFHSLWIETEDPQNNEPHVT